MYAVPTYTMPSCAQISATALLRDGVAEAVWVLCPELSTRVLVHGLWFCLWKIAFKGVQHGITGQPGSVESPLLRLFKTYWKSIFRAFGCFWEFQERLGVPGIDSNSSCKEMVFYRFLMPTWLQLASQNRLKSLKIRCQDALHLELQF